MRKNKKGFTLVEVALFLAVSGLLVAGIISSTNRSLSRQRYNNSVETFKDFLSNVYSKVLYTQTSSVPAGRSERAIYGELVNFGEDPNSTTIHTYAVVGEILSGKKLNEISNLTTLHALDRVEITILEDGESTYEPKWDAKIEGKETNKILEKSILIVRSPISGAISTYVAPRMINPHESGHPDLQTYLPSWNGMRKQNSELFETAQIDFCLDSNDKWAAGNFRRDIRINENAHNSSAIEIIADDDEGNQCREE